MTTATATNTSKVSEVSPFRTDAPVTTATFIKNEFGWMEGKTLAKVRKMNASEARLFYWQIGRYQVALVVEFTDGTAFVPSQDEEGNGTGYLMSLTAPLPCA